MTDDCYDLFDGEMEELGDTDVDEVLPYYVIDEATYECPLGITGVIRFAIEVMSGRVIAA
jgi:hypothetical protein